MNTQEAVNRPRFHRHWKPDKLFLEDGFSPDTVAPLRRRGHEIGSISAVAAGEAIFDDGEYSQGAGDPQGHGRAAGY